MNEERKELVCKHKKFVGKNQTIIEGKVVINNSDLKKVEKIFCRAYVVNCESEKGVVKVSGKANFVAIYQTTENEIKQTSFDTEFATKVENSEINANDFCMAYASVVETDITNISSSDIKIAAVIDVYASIVTTRTINYVDTSSDCACKKSVESISYLSDINKQKIKTTFDIETKENISEVLLSSIMALPKKVSVNGDTVKLDAEMSANIVVNTGEYPFVKTISECVQIAEELDFKSDESRVIEAHLEVKDVATTVDNGVITVVVDLDVTMLEFCSTSIETIKDAFSTTHDVNLTIENYACDDALIPQIFDEKISASAEVNDSNMQIDKVAGASVKNLVLSNVYAGDENFVVEGLATITVFMETTVDENKDVSSIDVEVPFSIKNSFDNLTKDSVVSAKVVLCDVYAKHKRTNEIEVYGVIKIYATASNSENVVLVTDLTIGEAKTTNPNAISFVITNKAQEMFELAKNLNVTEEQLITQNPYLEEMLNGSTVVPENTEIIVYRRKS